MLLRRLGRSIYTEAAGKRAVRIVEVGPRDGLQNEPAGKILSVEIKTEFIRRLAEAGLRTIEVGSFVSPKWVPQMANTGQVIKSLESIKLAEDVKLPALVPNLKGLEDALGLKSARLNEVSVFTAASESFTKKNINMSIEDSLLKIEQVIKKASEHYLPVRGYVSTVIGCPYEGHVDPEKVLDVSKELLRLGCYEISLGDTIGVGSPGTVKPLLTLLSKHIPSDRLAVHFHDTFGQSLANILVALEHDIRIIDSATGGLGGCPYAPGASGNVATEDVLYMLNGLGYETGVDFEAVAKAGAFITEALVRPNRSKAGAAFLAKQNK